MGDPRSGHYALAECSVPVAGGSFRGNAQ